MKVKEIVSAIEQVAPLQLQEDYDNAGYQVGDPEAEVTGVLTCIDITEETVDRAIASGCQLIVAHHPLIFRAIKKITPSDYISRTILKAIKAGITLYAAHTNLDNAFGGVNYKMAEKLGLSDVEILAPIPSSRLVGVANAEKCGSGVIGYLKNPISAEELVQLVKDTFHSECIRTNFTVEPFSHNAKSCSNNIRCIALCGGSGSDFITDAERKGADAFISGEIGYHRLFGHDNILLLEAGHYETEQYTKELLQEIILERFPNTLIVDPSPALPREGGKSCNKTTK